MFSYLDFFAYFAMSFQGHTHLILTCSFCDRFLLSRIINYCHGMTCSSKDLRKIKTSFYAAFCFLTAIVVSGSYTNRLRFFNLVGQREQFDDFFSIT